MSRRQVSADMQLDASSEPRDLDRGHYSSRKTDLVHVGRGSSWFSDESWNRVASLVKRVSFICQ